MTADTDDPSPIDWEEVIIRLVAFTRSLANRKTWFGNGKVTSFLMGKEAEDYAFEAIGKYLEAPEKFDATKGELLDYLQYNLVRSLIANDVRKKENLITHNSLSHFEDDEDQNNLYLDRILPRIEALFPDEIDYNIIKEYIENEVQGDADVENIFLGLYIYGMKPKQIMKEFSMQPCAYNNGTRRLTTVINRAAEKFNKT